MYIYTYINKHTSEKLMIDTKISLFLIVFKDLYTCI